MESSVVPQPFAAKGRLTLEQVQQLPIGTELEFVHRKENGVEFVIERGLYNGLKPHNLGQAIRLNLVKSSNQPNTRFLSDSGLIPYKNADGKEWWNAHNYTRVAASQPTEVYYGSDGDTPLRRRYIAFQENGGLCEACGFGEWCVSWWHFNDKSVGYRPAGSSLKHRDEIARAKEVTVVNGVANEITIVNGVYNETPTEPTKQSLQVTTGVEPDSSVRIGYSNCSIELVLNRADAKALCDLLFRITE